MAEIKIAGEGDSRPKEQDFALAYAQKFWDAGNQVVFLTIALTFAVYFYELTNPFARILTKDYYPELLPLGIIGNGAVVVAVWRIYVHERRVTETITNSPILLDAVKSAFDIRIVLVVLNALGYLAVITTIFHQPFRVLP